MLTKVRDFLSKTREPVIVDHGIDIVAGLSWLMLGLWGLFYVAGEFNSISDITPYPYAIFWGAAIGSTGLLAGLAALSTLVPATIRFRLLRKQFELIMVSLMGGVLAFFPVSKFIGLFIPPFRITEFAALAVSLYFMILPSWRVFHLTKRIRALREVIKEAFHR